MSEKKKIELKPCPFCGGKAELTECDNDYFVKCTKCGVEQKLYRSEKTAKTAWNRRKSLDKDLIDVVRCKYCTHYILSEIPGASHYVCELYKMWQPIDHYCADGDRKK